MKTTYATQQTTIELHLNPEESAAIAEACSAADMQPDALVQQALRELVESINTSNVKQ